MTWQNLLIWSFQAAITFAFSTFLFDALHYLLHRWRNSRFALLREFARWHWVHHEFLDRDLQVNRSKLRQNLIAHVLPEFLTGLAGTLIFLAIFDWPPVAAVVVLRVVFLILTVYVEGVDANHMAMDRVDGQQNMVWVDAPYHAMHHVFPNNFYSSFLNLFDLVFGTACQMEGRKFAISGTGGAFGAALATRLTAMGAEVRTLKHGTHFKPGDIRGAEEILQWADVLVLSHGAKSVDCMNANCHTFVELIDRFAEIGQMRLVPPEVWALGSEAEIHGTMGDESIRDYVDSKRAFAMHGLGYYQSSHLLYRHIVPSAFTSAMGKGPMSADTAVGIALFFITRGFRYVPVTLTSLAFWNFFRFRFMQAKPPAPTIGDPQEQTGGA